MQAYWLVTVPNNMQSRDTTLGALRAQVSNCKFHLFDVPTLAYGNLDSLMTLSDDLGKINAQVENVVRKVDRQYLEVVEAPVTSLLVGSLQPEQYLRNFTWDFSRYQHSGRPLSELVSQIQSMAAKVDDELKKWSTNYNDKTQALTALQRKTTINLVTSDFEDFLTPEKVASLNIYRADADRHLETVMVVVPKALEEEFNRTYETLGSTIVNIPVTERGDPSQCSPVVPTSAVKVLEEGENVLYSVGVIKYHYVPGKLEGDTFVAGSIVSYLEPLKLAFREKRFVIREFTYDGNKPGGGGLEGQIQAAKDQAAQAKGGITRWCQAHFGEVYAGWVHLKVIRGFVESILRYGLPADHAAMFVEPVMAREKQVKAALSACVFKLCPQLALQNARSADAADEGGEEEGEDEEGLAYVFQKFSAIGSLAASS